jgi:hypothetical protein
VCGHEARVQAHVVGGIVPHQQQHLHRSKKYMQETCKALS